MARAFSQVLSARLKQAHARYYYVQRVEVQGSAGQVGRCAAGYQLGVSSMSSESKCRVAPGKTGGVLHVISWACRLCPASRSAG